jgi:hypothetical protein
MRFFVPIVAAMLAGRTALQLLRSRHISASTGNNFLSVMRQSRSATGLYADLPVWTLCGELPTGWPHERIKPGVGGTQPPQSV